MAQFTGTIEWISKEKDFGFLKRDDGQYFAVMGCESGELEKGFPVEFDIVRGTRGPEATNVGRAVTIVAAENA